MSVFRRSPAAGPPVGMGLGQKVPPMKGSIYPHAQMRERYSWRLTEVGRAGMHSNGLPQRPPPASARFESSMSSMSSTRRRRYWAATWEYS